MDRKPTVGESGDMGFIKANLKPWGGIPFCCWLALRDRLDEESGIEAALEEIEYKKTCSSVCKEDHSGLLQKNESKSTIGFKILNFKKGVSK